MMETDRELLELAAKAAGLSSFEWAGFKMLRVETGSRKGDNGYYWRPLTDDGDALRLAVKLGLEIYIDDGYCTTVSQDLLHDWDCGVTEYHKGVDMYAATRRAIVRAAAEIGKNMP